MIQNYSNMSMLEVAEHLMLRKKTPQSFKKIATEVSELMGLTEEELRKRITRFYADLTLSGKFVNVTADKWDLKSRQKYEVYENQFVYEEDELDLDDEEIEDEEEEEDLDDEDVDEEYEEDYDDDEDEI